MLSLSALSVSLVVSLFIPVLVGLLTKSSLSSGLKGLGMLVLNAVNALVVSAVVADGTAVVSKETFVAFALSLAISVASYTGVYKPLGLTSSEGGKLAPDKGIG